MFESALEEKAALYASGVLTQEEREQFEQELERQPEVLGLVRQLEEVAAAATLSLLAGEQPRASAALKDRLMAKLDAGIPQAAAAGFVMTGPDGLVQWVNDAFTQMCGYSLPELRGRKLGPLLQGKNTDPAAAARMRQAVHERRSCSEDILNYHKDGTPYWVNIQIAPIFDERGETRWLVAHERELQDRLLPV